MSVRKMAVILANGYNKGMESVTRRRPMNIMNTAAEHSAFG